MLWLLPAVFLSFGFGQLFKWSQRKNHIAPVVIAANYLVLLRLSLLLFPTPRRPVYFSPSALDWGRHWNIFHRLYAGNDPCAHAHRFRSYINVLSPSGCCPHFCRRLPVGRNGYRPTDRWLRSCPASLLLLSWRPGEPSQRRNLYLVAAIFVLQGLSMCCLHWVHQAGLDEERLHVLMVTAATAGILGSLFVAVRRIPVRAPTALAGAGIGVFNLVTLSISLTALSQIQGTIFSY